MGHAIDDIAIAAADGRDPADDERGAAARFHAERSALERHAARRQDLVAQWKQAAQSGAPAGEQSVEDYHATLYATISDERDIKQDYTFSDRAALAWAHLKGQLHALPGCGKHKQCEQLTRESIDTRLMSERTKEYQTAFNARFSQAKRLLADSSRMLENYAQQRLEHHTAMVQYADNAAMLNEDVAIMRSRLERVKEAGSAAQTTDDRRDLCIEAGRLQNELDETELSRNSLAGKCGHHTNMMMVYAILHSSMKQQYQCVDTIVNVLEERRTHINELLSGYETGNNPAMVTKFRQELQQCHLVRGRLTALDQEYQQRSAELLAVPKLQDKDLYAAFEKTQRLAAQDSDEGQQRFMRQYKETLGKALR